MSSESLRAVQRGAARAMAAVLLALLWLPAAACRSAESEPQLAGVDRAIHLLNRATYGARPEDVDSLLAMGADAWLQRQLNPTAIEGPTSPGRPAGAGGAVDRGMEAASLARMTMSIDQQMANLGLLAALREVALGDAMAKLHRAVRSPNQLEEVMTDFWFNHFNVYSGKDRVRGVLSDFERSAIRQHVFGRFEDMLAATARHPAMLMYLDNYLSRAAAGDSATAGGGINENYARELLELHTIGVDGGYTERDVVEVARAFSGWTISSRPVRPGVRTVTTKPIAFEFDSAWHDTGGKVVLGHALAAGRGVEDGEDVLRILSRHPATARHIATKLVRHFVTDHPPASLVEELASIFIATDGDLREVTRALFTSDAFYMVSHYRGKIKRPFEFVASSLRMIGAEPVVISSMFSPHTGIMRELMALRHIPYGEPAPTGHPTTADEWVSAGAMLARMNFALALTGGRFPEAGLDPSFGFGPGTPADTSLAGAAQLGPEPAVIAATVMTRILPGGPVGDLEPLIAEDLAMHAPAEPRALLARAVSLALGSPVFQRY